MTLWVVNYELPPIEPDEEAGPPSTRVFEAHDIDTPHGLIDLHNDIDEALRFPSASITLTPQ